MSFSLEQEATDLTTPGDRLRVLAAINPTLQRLVAANLAAEPDLLEQLSNSRDRHVQAAVAANPNTAPTVLYRLSAEFPHAFVRNPVLPLLLLENPNLFADLPLETIYKLLEQEAAPLLLLEWATDQANSRLRWLVACHPNTPSHLLDRLVANGFRFSQQQPHTLETLSYQDKQVLRVLTARPDLPLKTLEMLIDLPNSVLLHKSLVRNPNTSATTLDKIARSPMSDDEMSYRKRLARIVEHANTSTETLEWIVRQPGKGVVFEQAVIGRPNVSWSLLRSLLLEHRPTNHKIIQVLKVHPALPWADIEAEATDLSFPLVKLLLSNLSAPPQSVTKTG